MGRGPSRVPGPLCKDRTPPLPIPLVAVSFPIYIQTNYSSRYSLLGAMASELAAAFASGGALVNPSIESVRPGAQPGMVLWFNFLGDVAELKPEITRPGSRTALLQFFVDHPLNLWAEQIDVLSRLPNFRMALPCVDGLHLLRLRWPTLRHAHCLHGVPESALCDAGAIERGHCAAPEQGRRANDVIVLGSIHSVEELDEMRSNIPPRILGLADEIVEMLACEPHTPFEHAVDVVAGSDGLVTGEWRLLSNLFKYVVASLNRRRRTALVEAMQGVRTAVYGAEAWREFCAGTIEYRGHADYANTPRLLADSRICLAWGPTQFTHTFSERLLLGMAAGCATLADDRLMVRRHFACADGAGARVAAFQPGPRAPGERDAPTSVRLVPGASPEAARVAVEALLANPAECAAMGAAAREAVASGHLWVHRLQRLAAVGSDALAA